MNTQKKVKKPGYTKIFNVMLEASLISLSTVNEYRVLYAIWRKTLGFRKLQDKISLSQIRKASNISQSGIIRALRVLEEKGFILRKVGGQGRGNSSTLYWNTSLDLYQRIIDNHKASIVENKRSHDVTFSNEIKGHTVKIKGHTVSPFNPPIKGHTVGLTKEIRDIKKKTKGGDPLNPPSFFSSGKREEKKKKEVELANPDTVYLENKDAIDKLAKKYVLPIKRKLEGKKGGGNE